MRKNNKPKRLLEEALPEPQGWRWELFDVTDLILPVIVFAVVFSTFFGMVFGVKGSSMYPTLHHTDLIYVSRLLYTPKAGDVVVLCKEGFPSEEESDPIVKRVIATAGQEVRIDFEKNLVYVDGVALDEPYINLTTDWPDPSSGQPAEHPWLEGDVMAPDDGMVYTDLVVPEGSIFVMGDNRNGSTDSRDYRLGPVDARYVMGKAEWVFYPFSRFGKVRS